MANTKIPNELLEIGAKAFGTSSIMIGDAVSDIEAGVNSNMDTMLLLSGRGEDAQKNLGEISPTYIAKDLAEGAGQILGMSS